MNYQYTLSGIASCSGWDCISFTLAMIVVLGTILYIAIIIGLLIYIPYLLKTGIDKYIESKINKHKSECRKPNLKTKKGA